MIGPPRARASLDISKSREFGQPSTRVYKAQARIAMEGYYNATHIDCDVIVVGEQELFVYWYGLFEQNGGEGDDGVGWMSRYVYQDL